MDKGRMTAAKILCQITDKGAYANVALDKALRHTELAELDRRLVTELVYGAVKAWGTLDYMLGCYVNRPLAKIPPMIRAILRLGFYQLFWLKKIPPSAAVNTAVELAKKYAHPGTVKFVNAVLRSAAREPQKCSFPTDDSALNLSLRGEHPLWLVRRWIKEFGYENAEKLVQYDNAPPELSLRTNTLKISRENLLAELQQSGAEVQISPLTPEGIIYRGNLPPSALTPLREGLCQAQDASSMLAAHILAPKPGEFIIDGCSAPGGKTTHLAALMRNRGKIVAGDVHEHKLRLVEENAKRLNIDIIKTKILDARDLGKAYSEAADRVLIDAPCSGLGVLRRRADARWRKSEGLLAELLPLQREILRGAAAAVKPGGVLVYSTCTMENEENAAMVESFLQSETDFTLEPAGQFLPCVKRDTPFIRLYPHLDGVDGFFIARMRKRKT